ncbi:hypothetical protein BLL42_14510 [Pseudomonas frederiksbergensis]|uniref:SH3b domain-containing protein n=1 Tax=Pseudomonas frederiksbergensis TaxID=104087 RepID=A0A1J0ETU6_9PSED|nr:hypothetical protein [Pseudomonas frederiksbergensis]APC19256.1 hypothetical protein BLL42_14510 [Pseudomonas frederiksbergensis]
MGILKNTLAIVSVIYSVGVFACDVQADKAFPSLLTENGVVVFDEAPIEKEPGDASADEQIGIEVSFVSCSDGAKKLIGKLPFLADTGKVRAAFFARAGQDAKESLFVIHSVNIRSDTGVKYSGDYYTVHVYQDSANGYVRDERLSTYFGNGGDILSDDYKDLVHVFPYKSESSIIEKLVSTSYKSWYVGAPVDLTINKKTSIHSSPVLADVTRMYLVAGDKVKQEGVEAGWLSIMFKTPKGKEIRGWIKCENAGGC